MGLTGGLADSVLSYNFRTHFATPEIQICRISSSASSVVNIAHTVRHWFFLVRTSEGYSTKWQNIIIEMYLRLPRNQATQGKPVSLRRVMVTQILFLLSLFVWVYFYLVQCLP